MTVVFSVITPVYNPPADVLREMVESVLAQSFPNWELCLVNDASPAPHVRGMLDAFARQDPRIRVAHRDTNGGIVAASNDAVAMARGTFLALVDNDDLLHPDALAAVNHAISVEEDADYLYTDEDKIDEAGVHSAPFYKPSWSPDRFRTQMYTSHLSVLRRTLVNDVGGFRAEFEGSQDWDLILRVTDRTDCVVKVPGVFYSWRTLATSTAANPAAKGYAYEAATRAIQDHCDRIGFEATVRHDGDADWSGVYHLDPSLRESPRVSIVIPTAGGRREIRGADVVMIDHTLQSLISASTYQNWEAIVVADRAGLDVVTDVVTRLADDRISIEVYDKPFDFSDKCNVGSLRASGEYLLLLNDDIEVITPDWLERMLMWCRHEPIGVVGARLLYEDGRVQHAGVVLRRGDPGHVYHGFPGNRGGYVNNMRVASNWLAVTGACLMTPLDLYRSVGGLSLAFPWSFNDIDYCLKVYDAGYRIVLDPDVQLYHFESSSRSPDLQPGELNRLKERWQHVMDDDPYYPKGLDPKSIDFVPPVWARSGGPL